MSKISGKKLWLDEGVVHASKFLKLLMSTEERRSLSNSEQNLKMMSASFIYLHHIVEEEGLIDEEDPNYLFEDEILH